MKKTLLSLLSIFLLSSSLLAQEPPKEIDVKIPTELKTKPGRLLRIKAETQQKIVKWFIYSEEADLIPFESSKEAIFSSPTPGKYRVVVYTAAGDIPSDPKICVVTVEGENPDPPSPPGPGPLPTDPLVKKLTDAYKADTLVDKDKKLAALIAIYKNANALAINDRNILTVGQLYETLRKTALEVIGNDLDSIRQIIKVELDGKLPKGVNDPLDERNRMLCSVEFKRIEEALRKVK